MANIILLSCVRTQRKYKTTVRNLYYGAFFDKSLEYAESLNPHKILLLSSKYGLLRLDEEKEPYNVELRKKTANERKIWADNVVTKLVKETDINNDHFILLAIDLYLEYIQFSIKNKEIPMKGLRRGEKLKWLNDHLR
jgi:cytoplasmic iron level regulating protein YaaA (DUF328/UPF0246 family)